MHKNLKIVRRLSELRQITDAWKAAGETIGLVPTMGALHDGHMSLVKNARAQCDRVIASIFVNPKQFDREDDLEAYPRDEAADAAKLDAEGTDVLWAPDVGEMYPDGFTTSVKVTGITDCLCGATRAGHFDGVAVVVSKLLMQCQPDRAYFGRKDYQQLMVVRRMVRDLNMPIDIRGIDTVRENDGLAMSSRNWYLTDGERAVAPALFQCLTDIAETASNGRDFMKKIEDSKKLLAGQGFGQVDYLEVRDADTLELITRPTARKARAFAAIFLGKARLIDNVPVDPAL